MSPFIAALAVGIVGLIAAACHAQEQSPAKSPSLASGSQTETGSQKAKDKMEITIGSKTFAATLEDNPTANDLKTRLPMRVRMTELNGNEKYVDLPIPLPADAKGPGTIKAGDLLLYGDRTLVLFYKTFKTPYRYTRVGQIENPSLLGVAVGTGDVEVTFEAH